MSNNKMKYFVVQTSTMVKALNKRNAEALVFGEQKPHAGEEVLNDAQVWVDQIAARDVLENQA